MATVKEKKATAAPAEERAPSPEEAGAAFAPALSLSLERLRSVLAGLRERPPQVLHLEGGEAEERTALALWWAALLNCERNDGVPCLECAACLRIGAGVAPDLIALNGRKGSIKIDDVRALRPLLGEPPRFARKRVIVMLEAQALGIEAANSLLKSLEEPCPDTCFLFTCPQRERLLPTLISRGWVVTLPWPDPSRPLPEFLQEWELALAFFLEKGTGWLEKTAVKGALDSSGAQQIVLLGQKALADVLAGRKTSALARVLAPSGQVAPALDELFARCQEALQNQVNPGLVVDHMATRMHELIHGRMS